MWKFVLFSLAAMVVLFVLASAIALAGVLLGWHRDEVEVPKTPKSIFHF